MNSGTLDVRKKVILYRQSEAVLVQLATVEASPEPELERKRLYADYDQLEIKLKERLKGENKEAGLE